MTAPTVFISYSQDSDEHKDRVLRFADRLRDDGIDANLDQYQVAPKEGWVLWMEKQIRDSKIVLLVCTDTYLRRMMKEDDGKGFGVMWESTIIYQYLYNSGVVNEKFIPVVFGRENTKYIPMPLQSSTWHDVSAEDGYEALYRHVTDQPYTTKPELGKLKSLPPRVGASLQTEIPLPPDKISLAHLPSTSSDLFGREKELALLDKSWSDSRTNVMTLVAWGGVGKSALVNKWLTQMARDNYRGAERVYGWSFYSQGAAEGRQVSADQFIASALAWFGDPDPNLGTPWDKGERLAELVKQSRALLILDGLEPLQNPPPVETGRIKDPALVAFLRELARQNRGLVVITTRLAVDDLKDCVGDTIIERDLDNLSEEAGAAYLSHLGADGSEDDRKQASREFDGHALALTLMGSYLKVVHRGDIRKRKEIPRVMDERKQGSHARRVMASYEIFLKGKPGLDILRLMGLFDRPAEKGALDALRKEPAIDGLTDALQKMSGADWKYTVNDLRNLRLIAQEDPYDPDALDCHPLLREHFGEQLKETNPAAWREGNNRLYESYKVTAKEFPGTIQEMTPLFAAVMHGCQAGRHQEVLDEVYWKRIQRGNKFFNLTKLGAFGADLAALSGFFDGTSWRKPVDELSEGDKGFVLNQAGLCLRTLGRLAEAVQPIQAGLDVAIEQQDWKNAASTASTISELYLTHGDVAQALAYAEQSVQLADQSGDAFQRMHRRVRLADALHQSDHLEKSKSVFQESEEMQRKDQPEFPLLYALSGFQYCDLLLSQGDYAEVERRASQTLEWYKKATGASLLTLALDNLSLGRAFAKTCYVPETSKLLQAATYLNRAVDGLRQAGTQDYLPRGLLARAEFYRITGSLNKAQKDLDEAFSIATRGGMGLFVADCHLEYARLRVKDLKWKIVKSRTSDVQAALLNEAREHWKTAKEMIAKMGYHRRDKEVKELEKDLL
jgi:tetratricopeptide (TPR) repeat protein